VTAVRSFDLLIFDWDGTLADSVAAIVAAVQSGITALRLPARSDKQVAELIGISPFDGMRRLYPELDTPELLRQLREHRLQAGIQLAPARLFPGVEDALRQLHDRHLLAVATGKNRNGLAAALAGAPGVASLFAATRCAEDTADKPDPAMLREIIRACGVGVERALMIGDTTYDAAMAAAIGMPALGVASGVHDADTQRAAGVIDVIDSVAELPAWLGTPAAVRRARQR
jgi:phosphoglycolate phosphatase